MVSNWVRQYAALARELCPHLCATVIDRAESLALAHPVATFVTAVFVIPTFVLVAARAAKPVFETVFVELWDSSAQRRTESALQSINRLPKKAKDLIRRLRTTR